MPTTVPWLGHFLTLTRFSGNGNELNGAFPPVVPLVDVLDVDELEVDVEVDELLVLLVLELLVLLVPELLVLDVLVLLVELKMGAPNCPAPKVDWETLSFTLKLK